MSGAGPAGGAEQKARAGRPPPVTAAELLASEFSPDVVSMREAMAEMAPACPLEPAALLAAASERTGLSDFGDPAFRERLDILCRALHDDVDLSPPGVVSIHTQIVQMLANRLLVEDVVTQAPELLHVPVKAPIIIAGLPRTGTTHLHNLLAADPGLRSLPYWESLEPVLPETEAPGPGEPDPRVARTQMGLDFLDAALPDFGRMHEMTTWHAHEEIHLLAIDIAGMYFETMAPMPTWRDHYRAGDQTSSYAYLYRVLQVLQHLRPATRWVLKSPQHLEQFHPLTEVFPDATVVMTHRDPVSVTASMATMVAYSTRMTIDDLDPHTIGAYWSARTEDLLRSCVADRDALPAAHSMDVAFTDLMADQETQVRRIYELADQPYTEAARAAMARFAEEHPRGRNGTVTYAMGPLGLRSAERREALRFYSERFGLAEDWAGD